MEIIRRILNSAPLFAGLGASGCGELAPLCRLKPLAKDQVLFRHGEKSHAFFIVHSGAINLHRLDSKGREIVLRLFHPGDSLAEGTLCGLAEYPAHAKAVEAGQVLSIDRIGFLRYMQSHPDMPIRILDSIDKRNRYFIEQLERLQGRESGDRLVAWLLDSARQAHPAGGHSISLRHPKKVLAAELGVTPETLSRSFADLRDKRIITVEGRDITITDMDALRRSGCGARET
ncbi:MAG: Crp/Fnr family transcriptional regulator [Fibrobacteria bacterium]